MSRVRSVVTMRFLIILALLVFGNDQLGQQ